MNFHLQARPTRFVETTAARMVKAMIDEAMADEYPTLVMSEPGMGKTTAVRHYAVKKHQGIYWEVRESENTIKQMFRCLLQAMKVFNDCQHTHDLADILYARLPHEKEVGSQFLVVDEFQNLDLEALRELLRLAERCRIPLILSGNDKRLNRTASRDVALDQIRSRIGARVTIPPPLPEDCRSIAIDYDVEGKAAYAALASYGAQTSLRDLVKLLKASVRATLGGGTVQLRHVEQACLMLSGGDQKSLELLET